MSVETPHLIVESGHEIGRSFVIPEQGSRIGRAPENDLKLGDPALSRFQCRLFYRDGGLWVADLGSTNETLVNDNTIQETMLRSGDQITIGETVLRVVRSRLKLGEPEPSSVPTAAVIPTPAVVSTETNIVPADGVDLGLDSSGQPRQQTERKHVPGFWWIIGSALILTALVLILPTVMGKIKPNTNPANPGHAPKPKALDIAYEKIIADRDNIFRYELALNDNALQVKIDDIGNDRQIDERKELDPEVVQNLAKDLFTEGFFDTKELYEGVSPEGYESTDLMISVNTKTHRSRVLNKAIPKALEPVLMRIEMFAQTELGLLALSQTPEQLRAAAEQAYNNARKLYEDREVRYENLYNAIKQYEQVEWLLKTIEPKPEYYRQALSTLDDAREEFDEKLKNLNFNVDSRIHQQQWLEARDNLQLIMQVVPDPNHSAYVKARDQLISVETRIKK